VLVPAGRDQGRPACQTSQGYPPHNANRSRPAARPRGSSAPRAERYMVRHRFPCPAMSSSTARKPGEGRWMRNHRAKYCTVHGGEARIIAQRSRYSTFRSYCTIHMVPYSNIAGTGRYPHKKVEAARDESVHTVPRTEDSVLRDIAYFVCSFSRRFCILSSGVDRVHHNLFRMPIQSAEVSILIVAIPSSPSVERPKPKKQFHSRIIFACFAPRGLIIRLSSTV
jgi:hypothetical protein